MLLRNHKKFCLSTVFLRTYVFPIDLIEKLRFSSVFMEKRHLKASESFPNVTSKVFCPKVQVFDYRATQTKLSTFLKASPQLHPLSNEKMVDFSYFSLFTYTQILGYKFRITMMVHFNKLFD